MKIKMLPNWCKKVGIVVFFGSIIINFTYTESRESVYEGWNDGRNISNTQQIYNTSKLEPLIFEKTFGSKSLHYVNVLILFGMIIYMMSKEKIEDDYINKLRLESYQLTILLGLFITFIIYIISGNQSLNLDYFINLFMIFYFIIFAIKKRIY
jgi:hypothetical protein